jgi:peptide/nickel transport system substrate-binding protein
MFRPEFRVLATCAALVGLMAGALGGCSGGGGDAKGPGTGPGSAAASADPAGGLGVPNPPFEGDIPKGALRVEGGETGRYGGTLVLASAGNPKSFNPILQNEASTSEVIAGPVFATCWEFNNLAQVDEPALCEKYERSPDNLIYTFTLREGLRWSDGTPITVDDFAFSYNIITDPKIPSTVKDLFKQGKDEAGNDLFATMEKVDDRTFRFKLREPNVVFQYTVGSIYVIPRHKWQSVYEAGGFMQAMTVQTPPAEIISSGPFRIKAFAADERVVLERNPHYWKVDKAGNRLPYLDRVIFVVVPDFNVALLKFRDGETDVYEVRPEDVELLKRDTEKGKYQVVDLGPSFNTSYFMFNQDPGNTKDGKPFVDPVKLKWFRDKTFRKAISHAIDRNSIVNVIFQGRGQPHWTYTSPANKQWYYDQATQYPYSLDKARELLTQAGFVFKDGVLRDAAGNKVTFTAVTNSENGTRIALLNLLKDDFAKLGIEVTVQPVPFNELTTRLADTRDFEAVVLGWSSAVPPDPSQMRNVLLSGGRSHNWHPNQKQPATEWEKRIDALVSENSRVAELEARKKAFHEIEAIFSDELPQIGLAVYNDHAAGRLNLGNFRPAPLRPKTHWNVDELFFKTPKAR